MDEAEDVTLCDDDDVACGHVRRRVRGLGLFGRHDVTSGGDGAIEASEEEEVACQWRVVGLCVRGAVLHRAERSGEERARNANASGVS